MSITTALKPQHVFGPAKPTKCDLMGIRFMVPPDDDLGGYTPPATQADLDALIQKAKGSVEKKYAGFDDIKSKAEKWDSHEAELAKKKPEPKPDDAKPTPGLSEDEVNTRISDALAKKDAELALERAGDALDKALEGRTFPASLVRTVDLTQFVKDNKTDAAAIKAWVEENTQEGAKPAKGDPGQGKRGNSDGGSTVQSGRDLFESRHGKKKD